MEANKDVGEMPLTVVPCFNLARVPPHSRGKNTVAFAGAEGRFRLFGNCWYPFPKHQDVNPDLGLWPVSVS